MFITNRPYMLDLAYELGLEGNIIGVNKELAGAMVLSNGRLVKIPAGFVMLAPSKIMPFLESPVLSPFGKLRALMELALPAKLGSEDESLADFVRRRFGGEFLAKLAQPMVAGVYVGDAEKLSARAVAERFVEMERTEGSVIKALLKSGGSQDSGARYGLFASFDKGLSLLIERLAEVLAGRGVKLRTDTRLTAIERRDSRIELSFADGNKLSCDHLVLATPAKESGRLLKGLHQNLSAKLSTIESASSAVVNFIFDHSQLGIEVPAFGAVFPAVEQAKMGLTLVAMSFASNKFAGRAPAGKLVLRAFAGGVGQEKTVCRTDLELTQLALADLRKLLRIKGDPSYVGVNRWMDSMPQYNLGHLRLVWEIGKLEAEIPGIYLGGASFSGVGLPDCVNSGNLCAEKILSSLQVAQLSV
jgi:oxygen-dependent protoporphyrinogen oxidase